MKVYKFKRDDRLVFTNQYLYEVANGNLPMFGEAGCPKMTTIKRELTSPLIKCGSVGCRDLFYVNTNKGVIFAVKIHRRDKTSIFLAKSNFRAIDLLTIKSYKLIISESAFRLLSKKCKSRILRLRDASLISVLISKGRGLKNVKHLK